MEKKSKTIIGYTEASALTGVPTGTLSSSVFKGNGPPHERVTGRICFDRDELMAWADARSRGPRFETVDVPAKDTVIGYAEAAKLVSVAASSISAAVQRGNGPDVKMVGRSATFNKASLMRWANGRSQRGRTSTAITWTDLNLPRDIVTDLKVAGYETAGEVYRSQRRKIHRLLGRSTADVVRQAKLVFRKSVKSKPRRKTEPAPYGDVVVPSDVDIKEVPKDSVAIKLELALKVNEILKAQLAACRAANVELAKKNPDYSS